MRGFGDLSPEWEERLLEAIPKAYDRVIDAALSRKVDFVVLAGDMFDTSRASYGDYLHFFEGLQRLDEAGIPSFLIGGNHDPFSSWGGSLGRLPASSRFLGGESPEFVLFERDGEPLCLIGARGYSTQAWPIDEPIAGGISRAEAIEALKLAHPKAADAPFCIGVIHTGLDIDQSKAYSDPAALLNSDVDYWACGHLHKRNALPSAERPRIVFPGCTQGRDLKEAGVRGCYVVDMAREADELEPRVSLEFVPTANVVFHTMRIDVSTCVTLAEAAKLIQNGLFHENGRDHCEQMVVRIVLEGETDLHGYLRKPDVLQAMRKRINDAYPMFYCDALVDRTTPKRDRDAMKAEGLFAAHVLRVSDLQQMRSDEMVNYLQSEFVKRGIEIPSALPSRLGDFAQAAETLVLDLLEEEAR